MVNGFLELTTYPAQWVCAIFQDIVPVVIGLDGLVLGSDDKTLCFRFQPRCFESLVYHLLVYLPLTYSFWVLPVHLFLFPFLLNLVLSTTLCFFFHPPSMGGWSFIFKLRCIKEVELSAKNFCLASYRVLFLLFLMIPNNPKKGIIFGFQISICAYCCCFIGSFQLD